MIYLHGFDTSFPEKPPTAQTLNPYIILEKRSTSVQHIDRYIFAGLITAALGSLLFVLIGRYSPFNQQVAGTPAGSIEQLDAFPAVVPTLRYGFALDTFQVEEGQITPGMILGQLLQDRGMDYRAIEQLARNADSVFRVTKIRLGKPYALLSRDSTQGPDYFIYEPNAYEYVVYHLRDDLEVKRVKRPVEKRIRASAGQINSSLWQAMVENGMSFELAAKMEGVLQWSVDFHHLQKGDQFKLIYEEDFVQGEQVGIGDIKAAYYKSGAKTYHAFYYRSEEQEGYYDLEGRPMKAPFLKAPVKYSRISSRYNLRRYHPILKRVRPHYGTDYAAPYGTPIYAVGDGVVSHAAYTSGNGRYVKIRHNDTYQTQYLHMQAFADGIRKGVQVRQGQVIGYVGSTGLATGPHVCFRFWKNGKQVNHLRLNFPAEDPLPEDELPAYFELRDRYLAQLEAVSMVESPAGEATANSGEQGSDNP